eukprot:6184840-Pleurochrysis_carterae.AAC.1
MSSGWSCTTHRTKWEKVSGDPSGILWKSRIQLRYWATLRSVVRSPPRRKYLRYAETSLPNGLRTTRKEVCRSLSFLCLLAALTARDSLRASVSEKGWQSKTVAAAAASVTAAAVSPEKVVLALSRAAAAEVSAPRGVVLGDEDRAEGAGDPSRLRKVARSRPASRFRQECKGFEDGAARCKLDGAVVKGRGCRRLQESEGQRWHSGTGGEGMRQGGMGGMGWGVVVEGSCGGGARCGNGGGCGRRKGPSSKSCRFSAKAATEGHDVCAANIKV